MTRNLAEAEDKLKEVFDRVFAEGPQTISGEGASENVVIISQSEYDRLRAQAQPPDTTNHPSGNPFLELLLSAPKLTEEELKLFERDKSPTRHIDLTE